MNREGSLGWKPGDFIAWVIGHPLPVILLFFAVTILFAWRIPQLSFNTSIYDLVIEDLPETARYQAFKKVFGSDEIIRLVLKAEDVYQPEVFAVLEQLAEKTAAIGGVRRVIGLPAAKKAVDPGGKMDLKAFAALLGPISLFQGNMVSADRRTTALTLVLTAEADQAAVIHAVQGLIERRPGGLDGYQIGMPLVSQALETFTRKDFFRLPPLTFALIAFMLLVLVRSMAGSLIPLLCVTCSLVWTFGFMAWTQVPLSILTMIVPVFLIAVGTAYCLHIVSEYTAVAREASDPAAAARQTFAEMTFPTVLAVVTTVIGLGSLLINRIPAIREFALFASFGMFSLLVVVLTLCPAVLALLPLPPAARREKAAAGSGLLGRVIEGIIALDLRHQRWTLPVIGLVVVFCLAGIFRIRVESNPVGYFRADTEVSRNFHDIYRHLSGSFPVNVVMSGAEDDWFEKAAHVSQIAHMQEFLDTLPGVDKTVSFADYLKLVNYASNRFEEKFYTLPEEDFEVRMLINTYRMMLGEDMLLRFMNPELSQANILMLTHMSSSRDFLAAREKILAHAGRNFPSEISWEVTGLGMVVSASSHLITSGQVKSLSLTMVLVFGIMFLLFLSSKVGMIAIVPNLFPIIVNFGIMGWLGIELSMFTSLIASIAIGLAVDDTIHYLVRYNQEFRKDLDNRKALGNTIRRIGRPIIFTTLTISTGFAVLGFSSFQPTAIFGGMMVVTLLSALVGDLVLLPSLMMHVELVTLWDLVRLKMGTEPRHGIPLFKGLSRTQVHYIIMAGSLKVLTAGEFLFRQGDPSDSMYAVISGELDVLLDEDDGTPDRLQTHLNRLRRGDVVGEMGLLRTAPRSATVAAASDSELLQVNLKMIERLQWLYPPTAHRFFFNLMTILCDRIENVSHCLSEASTIDETTGLCNRRSFQRQLEDEINRSRRYDCPMTLCLFRLNGPLAVETAPDPTGDDRNLPQVAARITRDLRRCDTLGRIDTRTFALLMPQTPMRRARSICERMQQLVDQGGDRLYFSYGLAELGEDDRENGHELFDRASPPLPEA